MFDKSENVPISSRPAGNPTTKPATHVETAGVRYFGCTFEKTEGSSRSRDMANHTRACPIWKTRIDEIMPSSAPIRITSRTQCSVAPPWVRYNFFSVLTTGAASPTSWSHLISPVSTTATPIYNSVQTMRVARMPIGTSRCGFLHSSAAVDTESNPIYVKKIIEPPVSTPDHPLG